jgi:signal transduction histidine kinase
MGEGEGDPLAELAHDLRSPLTVIELYSGVMEAKGAALSDEQRDEYVAKIRKAVGDMRDAIDRATSR